MAWCQLRMAWCQLRMAWCQQRGWCQQGADASRGLIPARGWCQQGARSCAWLRWVAGIGKVEMAIVSLCHWKRNPMIENVVLNIYVQIYLYKYKYTCIQINIAKVEMAIVSLCHWERNPMIENVVVNSHLASVGRLNIEVDKTDGKSAKMFHNTIRAEPTDQQCRCQF